MLAQTQSPRALTYTWRDYHIFYECSGEGAPVVLLHGFGAGSSGFQWRRNVPVLSQHYTVYNLDLLGWGRSDRPRLEYNPDLYRTFIGDFLHEVVGSPCVLVGSFQTAAYALAVAAHQPDRVHALVLQTPTGLNYLRRQRPVGQAFYKLFYYTPLGGFLYGQIAGRNSVRSFMRQRMYTQPDRVDETMVEGFAHLAQQPGGRWGAIAFLTGKLNLDVRKLLPQVHQPTLVIWGDRTSFIPSSEARAFTGKLPNARSIILGPAEIWLNDERAEEWNQAVIGFLAGVAA